jgi:hypothetical protein
VLGIRWRSRGGKERRGALPVHDDAVREEDAFEGAFVVVWDAKVVELVAGELVWNLRATGWVSARATCVRGSGP